MVRLLGLFLFLTLCNYTDHLQEAADVDDVWDDTLVMKTWEESVRLVKEDVAKRIANSTNSQEGVSLVDTSAGERKLDWEPVPVLKAGDFCRATFKEDGIDYEAVIVSMDAHNRCLIKFLGYGNEQYTPLKELVASWGEEFRVEQIEAATLEAGASTEEADSNASTMNSDREEEVADKRTRCRTSKKRKSRNICPPMPPMPPTGDDSLHAMLMAWYMSGYYTGLYDAEGRAKKK